MPRKALAEEPMTREELVTELLDMRRIYALYEARDSEICALLKAEAADEGGNFQVTIDGLGRIKVSAPRDKAMKGEAPELVVNKFYALPDRKREALIEQGIVKMEPQYSGAYYG